MHYCIYILVILTIVCVIGGVILAFRIFFVGKIIAPDRVQIDIEGLFAGLKNKSGLETSC